MTYKTDLVGIAGDPMEKYPQSSLPTSRCQGGAYLAVETLLKFIEAVFLDAFAVNPWFIK